MKKATLILTFAIAAIFAKAGNNAGCTTEALANVAVTADGIEAFEAADTLQDSTCKQRGNHNNAPKDTLNAFVSNMLSAESKKAPSLGDFSSTNTDKKYFCTNFGNPSAGDVRRIPWATQEQRSLSEKQHKVENVMKSVRSDLRKMNTKERLERKEPREVVNNMLGRNWWRGKDSGVIFRWDFK